MLFGSDEIAGSCGLITDDFIRCMDLYPWLCAVYVEEKFHRHGCGCALIDHAVNAAFGMLYGSLRWYEKYDFQYIGIEFHLRDENSRIYCCRKKTVVDAVC